MLRRHATGALRWRRQNSLHVHVHGIHFACFLDPAMHAPCGWLGAGVRGGAWARVFYCMQLVVHKRWVLVGCITAPFFAVPNLASAQVGARRGSAAESRGHFLASPTWISRKWDPGEGAR